MMHLRLLSGLSHVRSRGVSRVPCLVLSLVVFLALLPLSFLVLSIVLSAALFPVLILALSTVLLIFSSQLFPRILSPALSTVPSGILTRVFPFPSRLLVSFPSRVLPSSLSAALSTAPSDILPHVFYPFPSRLLFPSRILPAVLACALILGPAATHAQQAPRVTAELSAEETIVGQPLMLRVKVLVPSFMPSPPVFPDFEVPGLLIRLPERASSPTSETIGGESWSGVQRSYRLYPLVPGPVTLPGGDLQVTYSTGGASDAETTAVPLPPITFTATLPEGARDLSPLILASGFTLEETVEIPEDLAVGGAVTRVVTASIAGTTPILIPPLTGAETPPGLRAYPDEPRVSDREERGVLSGERVERVVFLPELAGSASLPAIAFDWYNIETGKIERAELPEHAFDVAPGPEPARLPPDPRQLALIVALVTLALALLEAVRRFGLPLARRWLATQVARWRASERHAHHQVTRALARRDLTALNRALAVWQPQLEAMADPALLAPGLARLDAALARIGAARYGPNRGTGEDAGWTAARQACSALRRVARSGRAGVAALPALNP